MNRATLTRPRFLARSVKGSNVSDRICSVPNCPHPAVTRGWCGGHYRRWRMKGHPGTTLLAPRISSPLESFRAKYRILDVPGHGMVTPCWEWTAFVMPNGYGTFRNGSNSTHGNGGLAHRWSWLLHRGDIPNQLQLDHLCHTADPACPGGACCHRRCVNPDHLEPVTGRVNLHRGPTTLTSIFAAKTHCPQNHLYDDVNTYWTPDGHRQCRICRAMHHITARGTV